MKTNVSWFLPAAALLSIVHSQNMTELIADTPKCALGCVLSGLSDFNCTISTIATCLCTNISFQSELSTCVQQSCGFEDQVRAVEVESGLCAGAPQESRSSEIRLVAVILSAITFPIVALRCVSRWTVTRQLWWDDWAALAATFFLMVLGGIEIASASMGFGNHYWNVSFSEGTTLLKLFYVVQMLYIMIQVAAKLSILILYHRVFPRPWFKLATKIMMAFLIMHGFAFVVVIVFQCWPIYSIWDRTVSGKCVDLVAVIYTGAVISIVEDLLILVLPISELNTLSFGIRKRISLMLMFGIGSFACVTSMIRLKYLIAFGNSFDSTWDNVDVVIWSMIELYTALICACLPSLRPLLVQYLPSIFKSLTTTKNNTAGDNSAYKLSPWKPSMRKHDSYGGLGDGVDVLDGCHFRNDSTAKVGIDEEKGIRVVEVVDVKEEMSEMEGDGEEEGSRGRERGRKRDTFQARQGRAMEHSKLPSTSTVIYSPSTRKDSRHGRR